MTETVTAFAGADQSDVAEPAAVLRVLAASRALRINLVLAAFTVAWLLSQLAAPSGPQVLGWFAAPAALAVSCWACWHVSRAGGQMSVAAAAVPRRVRRFWALVSVGLAMTACAAVSSAYDAVYGPGAPTQSYATRTTVMYLAGVAAIAWAVLTLPVRRWALRQFVTFALDMAIVIVSASLVGYHLVVMANDEPPSCSLSALPMVALTTLALAALTALIRVGATDGGPLDRYARWTLGVTLLFAVSAGAAAPLMAPWPYLSNAQIVIPLACVGLTAAALMQRHPRVGPQRRPVRALARPWQHYSALPYLAIAMTDTLLLLSARHPGRELPVFIVGSVVLTLAVVLRQLLVFADHARVLHRLDASLLELSRHEQRFRSLVQNSSDIIAITSPDRVLMYASPGLERLSGVPIEDWMGSDLGDHIHPEDRAELDQASAVLADPGGTARFQARMRHRDGGWRCVEIVSTNRVDDPSVAGIVSNLRDVTETRRYQDELAYQASHDALTGLANRAVFNAETGRAVRRAEAVTGVASASGPEGAASFGPEGAASFGPEGAASFGPAIVLVDLDDFKAVNDHLGHGVGDALLLAVAARLQGCVRPEDMVARLGGDEFAVLLFDVPPAVADRIADSMITTLAVPVSAAGHDLLVQASIGVARYEPGCDASELLRRADVAMYAAKEMGKGCYAAYRQELDAHAVEHASLAADLRQAIGRGELTLVYQPIVRLPDGTITAVEALARWEHPQRGPVPPDVFIPVAERTGIIVPIGAWVLYEACRQAAVWQATLGAAAPARVSVNVSARQLVERSFTAVVAAALHTVGLEPHRLVIEITETAVFNGGRALDTVRDLHEMGVKIALDDFGTGHSSLGLLRSCPVNVLKVDKSFVDGVTGTLEQEAIAASIGQIAQAMRLDAVAEGVETANQAERLHDLGYRLAQGYYFARPLDPEQLSRYCGVGGVRVPVG